MEKIYELIGFFSVHGILGFIVPKDQPIINFIGSLIIIIFFIMAWVFYYNKELLLANKDIKEKNISDNEIRKYNEYKNYMLLGALITYLLLHIISIY
tara:strand:+ start:435 stop:725 length:291 start_codon:yes stop_codon:yes gene_type:complete